METINLLEQFVQDHPDCRHRATVPYGVAFSYRDSECKFSLVITPMFNVEVGKVALIVANTQMGPKILLQLNLNDPQLFQKFIKMLDFIITCETNDEPTSFEDVLGPAIII